MNEADPLKNIILRIVIALVSAIVLVNLFKPLVELASEFATCPNCDTLTANFLISLVFMGAIGIAMYKFFGIFTKQVS